MPLGGSRTIGRCCSRHHPFPSLDHAVLHLVDGVEYKVLYKPGSCILPFERTAKALQKVPNTGFQSATWISFTKIGMKRFLLEHFGHYRHPAARHVAKHIAIKVHLQRCHLASGKKSAIDSTKPMLASVVNNRTQVKPRSLRCRKNEDQPALSSLAPSATPSCQPACKNDPLPASKNDPHDSRKGVYHESTGCMLAPDDHIGRAGDDQGRSVA